MNPLELAHEYMNLVFTTCELDLLRNILAEELSFIGPYFTYNKAEDYIDSLKADPPEAFKYEMIKAYEDSTSACLVYRFWKPGIHTIMTQIFEAQNDKITRILLVFDTGAFRQK
jgi:hypothetical protein